MTNPGEVRVFPEPNPGVILALNLTSELTVSGSVMDAESDGTNPNAPGPLSANYAYFYEVWFDPTVPGWGQGKYHLPIQGIDGTSAGPASTVCLLSCQRDVGAVGGIRLALEQ